MPKLKALIRKLDPRRYIGEGVMIPAWYGVAWYSHVNRTMCCLPIGLNVIACIGRAMWYHTKHGVGPIVSDSRAAYHVGYSHGRNSVSRSGCLTCGADPDHGDIQTKALIDVGWASLERNKQFYEVWLVWPDGVGSEMRRYMGALRAVDPESYEIEAKRIRYVGVEADPGGRT